MMMAGSPSVLDVAPSSVANDVALDTVSTPSSAVLEVELEAKPTDVELAPGHVVSMWTYNGALPGPRIEAHVGDTVRVHLKNSLPESTTIHWHGLRLPNAMDGAPAVQREVAPGETFTYEFVVEDSGTFWYHPHVRSDVQIERGLYGSIVVHGDDEPAVDGDHVVVLDDVLLDRAWQIADGSSMMEAMTGREGNLLLANGYANPSFSLPAGSLQRFRFINTANARFFRMALGGHALVQIGADGALFREPEMATDVLIVPGQRVDVLVQLAANETGTLAFQTLPYARGHGANGGAVHDVFQLALGAPLPEATPLPAELVDVPALPAAAVARTLKLGEQTMGAGMHGGMGMAGPSARSTGPTFSFNGQVYPKVTPLVAALGSVEEWSLENTTSMDHPFHLHGFRFQVVKGAGREPTRRAWRDTINVPAKETVRIRMRLEEHPGMWMFHCHLLEHAERGMMGELDVRE
jgi:FtsP/CotA-like multicopper oxidase with cupredoxin domain